MSFVKGGGTLVGANMKKNGTLLLQIEVSGELQSDADYARLRKMMNTEIGFSLDGQIVKYNVQVNALTEKPIKSYKVDDHGVVSEVKPEGEQLELDLSVPRKADPITEVPEEINREVVDEFILSGLAPQPKGFYPLQSWIARLESGETYQMIASEQGMNSGKVADLIDEYRMTCAPLAAAWDEWRQNGGTPASNDEEERESNSASPEQPEAGEDDQLDDSNSSEDIVIEDEQQQETNQREDDELNDYEKEIMGETGQPTVNESEPTAEDLDEYILQAKPKFEDIPYDFPSLLERKKGGETWMEIANSIGTRSGVLATAWTKYRKKVKKLRNGGAA